MRPGPKLILFFVAILPLFWAEAGHASHHFPDYPVRPASEYPNKAVAGSITVAAEAVEDPAQQKTYFNTHFNSRGYLPVLLVIQNGSPTDTYLFDRSAVGLADPGELTGKGAHKTESLLSSGGTIDLSLTGKDDVTNVRENLMKKEVRSKTLSPGSSVSGFIYVPVPRDAPRSKIHLQVPVTNTQSGEITVLNLLL